MTDKHEPIETERAPEAKTEVSDEQALQERRGFLLGLGTWSRAVIVGAVAGGVLLTDRPAQAAWINRRGGGGRGWLNGRSGGGSWVNRRGGGYGGSWVNRR
ncbi:MAG: hypothetical protein WBG92_03080 [Thiohalocapsa sp.]